MNKYLLMSAAAALASTAAQAGTAVHSWTFGTSGGGSYCDGGTLYTNGSTFDTWIHTNNNCASGTSIGLGSTGALDTPPGKKKAKKSVNLSDNLEAKNYGDYTASLSWILPTKIKAGSPWALYLSFSGTTSFALNSGVLNNVTPGHKGTKSTTHMLQAMIKQHQASKHS